MKNLEIQYISAAREEDAIGIAVGAYLAGKRPIVLMQNSGLANCVNCLTSLLIPSKIPVLFLVSWRGCPKEKDEPMYHYVMGKTGIGLMKKIGINVQIVSKKDPENSILNSIKKMRKNHLPSVIFLRRHLLL
jgi:phosphonopyruvate decarboxylase